MKTKPQPFSEETTSTVSGTSKRTFDFGTRRHVFTLVILLILVTRSLLSSRVDTLLSYYYPHQTYVSDQRINEAVDGAEILEAFDGVDEPIGKAAIFYNIFTAPGNSNATLKIVEEQLTTWRASNVANATLYYSLLGEKIELPCKSNEKCSLLLHKEEGNELDTLQELHRYCTNNPQDSVIYIHSKGSFHAKMENTLLRRLLTKAVFSDACTSFTTDDNSCNVCSARFSPLPHWHASGNMWMARCDHIHNLIAPKSFQEQVEKYVQEAVIHWRYAPSDEDSVSGRGRFASEHWVHTHPRIKPCDTYTPANYVWGYSLNLESDPKFERAKAPRFPRSHYVTLRKKPPEFAFSPWINLEYRLFELKSLYNETPPVDSWVWDFYLKQ
jgi:hypothetical protein